MARRSRRITRKRRPVSDDRRRKSRGRKRRSSGSKRRYSGSKRRSVGRKRRSVGRKRRSSGSKRRSVSRKRGLINLSGGMNAPQIPPMLLSLGFPEEEVRVAYEWNRRDAARTAAFLRDSGSPAAPPPAEELQAEELPLVPPLFLASPASPKPSAGEALWEVENKDGVWQAYNKDLSTQLEVAYNKKERTDLSDEERAEARFVTLGPVWNSEDVRHVDVIKKKQIGLAGKNAVRRRVIQDFEAASGVSITGHPSAAFNGVYTHDLTHEGWPVLKSASGMYCYHYAPENAWHLNDAFTPDSRKCHATIVAKDGRLPVGAHTWEVWDGKEWVEGTLTVTLLRTEEEVTEAKLRIQAEVEAAKAALAALATAQLASKTISIEGNPNAAYNGVYTHDSTHEGWPVLKNANGMYCYHFRQTGQWILTNDKTHFVTGKGWVRITAREEGLLPDGAHTWQWWDDGKFVDVTLTVDVRQVAEEDAPSPALHPAPAPSASPLPAPGPPPAAAPPGARTFTLLVKSDDEELLPNQRSIRGVEASSVEELNAGIQKKLELPDPVLVVQIYDDDFEEWIQLEEFKELPTKAKVKIQREARQAVEEEASQPSEGIAEAQILEVTCPYDVSAGDTLSVQYNDGEILEVAVPEGCAAGDVFEVIVEAEAAGGGPIVVFDWDCTITSQHLFKILSGWSGFTAIESFTKWCADEGIPNPIDIPLKHGSIVERMAFGGGEEGDGILRKMFREFMMGGEQRIADIRELLVDLRTKHDCTLCVLTRGETASLRILFDKVLPDWAPLFVGGWIANTANEYFTCDASGALSEQMPGLTTGGASKENMIEELFPFDSHTVMLVDDSITRGGSLTSSTAPGELGGGVIHLLDLPLEAGGLNGESMAMLRRKVGGEGGLADLARAQKAFAPLAEELEELEVQLEHMQEWNDLSLGETIPEAKFASLKEKVAPLQISKRLLELEKQGKPSIAAPAELTTEQAAQRDQLAGIGWYSLTLKKEDTKPLENDMELVVPASNITEMENAIQMTLELQNPVTIEVLDEDWLEGEDPMVEWIGVGEPEFEQVPRRARVKILNNTGWTEQQWSK